MIDDFFHAVVVGPYGDLELPGDDPCRGQDRAFGEFLLTPTGNFAHCHAGSPRGYVLANKYVTTDMADTQGSLARPSICT